MVTFAIIGLKDLERFLTEIVYDFIFEELSICTRRFKDSSGLKDVKGILKYDCKDRVSLLSRVTICISALLRHLSKRSG